MKNLRKILLAGLAALCIVTTAGAVVGCKGEEPTVKLPDDVGGVVITVEGSSPADSLGTAGDVCLCAESGKLYRKTADGWVEAAYESCDVDGTSLTVTYQDGSVGTYALTSEGETHDCTHENLASVEPVAIYEAKCVIPGIGVKTCPVCHESFPVILPATGVHRYGEGSFDCLDCGVANYFKDATLHEAEDWAPEGYYVVHDLGTVDFSGMEELEIPGHIKGLPVVIGENAFKSNKTLKKVTLDSDVIKIEKNAFQNCTALKEVTLPQTLTEIGDSAFSMCSLTSIDIPDSVTTIGVSAFDYCSSLKSVTLSENLTEIGRRAFSGCGITEITLPAKMEKVADSMFDNCTSLEKVTWPDALREIGNRAFYSCKFTSIDIPDTVTILEEGAFRNCTSLSTVTLSKELVEIGKQAFERCPITEISIPAKVETIGESAFTTNSWATEGTIASLTFEKDESGACALREIKKSAFYNQPISSLTIPASVEIIGDEAFVSEVMRPTLGHLLELVFEDDCRLKTIGKNAFNGFQGITDLVIPGTVTSIGDGAFFPTTQAKDVLKSIKFEEGTEPLTIGEQAFRFNAGLQKIEFCERIVEIGKSAFTQCGSQTAPLETIVFPASLERIGDQAFSSSYITSIEFAPGSRLVSIGQGFYGSSHTLGEGNYTELTLPGSVQSIGAYAFAPTLKSIKFPEGTIFTDGLLQGTSIEEVTIPRGTTVIASELFKDCTSLTSVNFEDPDSITEIGSAAFRGCTALAKFTMPKNLTKISGSAFYGCSLITEIEIPASVTTIGSSAFYQSGLTSIEIPDTVTELGGAAFFLCRDLKTATVGKGIKTLNGGTFRGCSSLESVTLPEGLEVIGEYAFGGYTITNPRDGTEIERVPCNIPSIEIPASVKRIEKYAFRQLPKNGEGDVKEAIGRLAHVTFAPNSQLEYIADQAFEYTPLEEFEIPANVKEIGANAFHRTTKMKQISFAAGSVIEKIGTGAFHTYSSCNTTKETALVLPKTLKYIGYVVRNGGPSYIIFEATDNWKMHQTVDGVEQVTDVDFTSYLENARTLITEHPGAYFTRDV